MEDTYTISQPLQNYTEGRQTTKDTYTICPPFQKFSDGRRTTKDTYTISPPLQNCTDGRRTTEEIYTISPHLLWWAKKCTLVNICFTSTSNSLSHVKTIRCPNDILRRHNILTIHFFTLSGLPVLSVYPCTTN